MGAYLCIASNGVPPSLSKRILLHVNCEFCKRFLVPNFKFQVRPKIRVQNQLISAHVGESVELMCQCEAYPKPMVTWITPIGLPVMMATASVQTTNGTSAIETAVPANKYIVEEVYQSYRTTMKLKINSISADDFGSFKCLAKNTLGEKEGLIRLYGE